MVRAVLGRGGVVEGVGSAVVLGGGLVVGAGGWFGCWGGVGSWAGWGLDADGQGNSCRMSRQDPVWQGQIIPCFGAMYAWVVYIKNL